MEFCLCYSQHWKTTSSIPVALDNPQNIPGTVFIGTAGYEKIAPIKFVQWVINLGELYASSSPSFFDRSWRHWTANASIFIITKNISSKRWIWSCPPPVYLHFHLIFLEADRNKKFYSETQHKVFFSVATWSSSLTVSKIKMILFSNADLLWRQCYYDDSRL